MNSKLPKLSFHFGSWFILYIEIHISILDHLRTLKNQTSICNLKIYWGNGCVSVYLSFISFALYWHIQCFRKLIMLKVDTWVCFRLYVTVCCLALCYAKGNKNVFSFQIDLFGFRFRRNIQWHIYYKSLISNVWNYNDTI